MFFLIVLIACIVLVTQSLSLVSLKGVICERVSSGEKVELLSELQSSKQGKTLLVLGTYAADFNAIEYAQRLRFYLPELKKRNVGRSILLLNAVPSSCRKLAQLLDLPSDIEILSDPDGTAGKAAGLSRGWMPDKDIRCDAEFIMILNYTIYRALNFR
jgi:hypothetical protein